MAGSRLQQLTPWLALVQADRRNMRDKMAEMNEAAANNLRGEWDKKADAERRNTAERMNEVADAAARNAVAPLKADMDRSMSIGLIH